MSFNRISINLYFASLRTSDKVSGIKYLLTLINSQENDNTLATSIIINSQENDTTLAKRMIEFTIWEVGRKKMVLLVFGIKSAS